MPMLGRGRKQTSRIFQNLYSLLLYSSIVYYASPTPCHSHDIPPAKEVMAESQPHYLGRYTVIGISSS